MILRYCPGCGENLSVFMDGGRGHGLKGWRVRYILRCESPACRSFHEEEVPPDIVMRMTGQNCLVDLYPPLQGTQISSRGWCPRCAGYLAGQADGVYCVNCGWRWTRVRAISSSR